MPESKASFNLFDATLVASPVNTVCLEAVVLPESGVKWVSGTSWTIFSGSRLAVSQTTWVITVPSPWPIQEALVLMWTLPSFITNLHLPTSGIPTPTPLFFIAQAIPARGCFSYSSFTASSVSAIAVPSSANWPFGKTCPGLIAFLYLISQGDIPTISASKFRLHSVAKQLCVTPNPLNAPPGGLLVYTAVPVISISW